MKGGVYRMLTVQLGNIQAGAPPFPVSEREFYAHKFRIS